MEPVGQKPTFLFPERVMPTEDGTFMSGELIVAVEYFQREKGIDKEILLEAVEQALLQASKKSVGPARDLRIEIDRKTGEIHAFAKLKVVELVANKNDEISLPDARRKNPAAQLGEDLDL